MLDVGFSEILLTSAIALIVLGPERLPKVARQVGNWMGRARAMARQLSEQLEREVNAEELLKAQTKANPTYTPSIAPPPGVTPEPPAMTSLVTPEPPAAAPESPANPPEPVYGLAASATTAEAMHPSDKPPPHE